MLIETVIYLEEQMNNKYKHLENNIAERTVRVSEKDIEIFKDILKRNGGGVTAPRYELHSIFKLISQITETNESDP